MSSTIKAPFAHLGPNGDYPIEINYAVRIYTPAETIPEIGQLAASLKGGLRTNHLGIVPVLDGQKEEIGKAEVTQIISAKPEHMKLEHLAACGFTTKASAIEYCQKEHGEEFNRDGVMTIFYYRITELY